MYLLNSYWLQLGDRSHAARSLSIATVLLKLSQTRQARKGLFTWSLSPINRLITNAWYPLNMIGPLGDG